MVFATLVDEGFLPGLYALLQSMSENAQLSPLTRLWVIYRGKQLAQYQAHLDRFGFDIRMVDAKELGEIPPQKDQVQARFHATFDKLLVFKLPEKEPVCFLDADMLCLGSLAEIGDMHPFSVAPDYGMTKPRTLKDSGKIAFNSGFMVLQPARETFEAILAYMDKRGKVFSGGDQGVLNFFFYDIAPQMVTLIDSSFNTLKRVSHYFPDDFDLNKIRLLHYVGRKPWAPDEPSGEEAEYGELNALWMGYFKRSLGQGG